MRLTCICVTSCIRHWAEQQIFKKTFLPFAHRNNDVLWNIIGSNWAEIAEFGAFPLFLWCLSDHLGNSSALFPSLLLEEILMCSFCDSLWFLFCASCMFPVLQTASKPTDRRDAPQHFLTSCSSSPLLCSYTTSFLVPLPSLTPPGPGRPPLLNHFFSQLLPKSIWGSPKGSQSLASEGVIFK